MDRARLCYPSYPSISALGRGGSRRRRGLNVLTLPRPVIPAACLVLALWFASLISSCMRARALVGDPVGLIRLLHCMRASPLACQPGSSRIIHFRRLRCDEEILKAPSFVDNDDVVARLDC